MFPLATTTDRLFCLKGPEIFNIRNTIFLYLDNHQISDKQLPFSTLLEVLGFDQTLWCMQAEPQFLNLWFRFGVWCARQIPPELFDKPSIQALETTEMFMGGRATEQDLQEAQEMATSEVKKYNPFQSMDDHDNVDTWTRFSAARAIRDITLSPKDTSCKNLSRSVSQSAITLAWNYSLKTDPEGRSLDGYKEFQQAKEAAQFAQADAFKGLVTVGLLPLLPIHEKTN